MHYLLKKIVKLLQVDSLDVIINDILRPLDNGNEHPVTHQTDNISVEVKNTSSNVIPFKRKKSSDVSFN